MTDTNLRERLERLASQIAVEPLPTDRIVTSGRRRRARRIAGSTIAAMAVIATFAWAAQATLFVRPASRLPAGTGDMTRIGGPGITSIRLPGSAGSLAFAEGRIWATAHDGNTLVGRNHPRIPSVSIRPTTSRRWG